MKTETTENPLGIPMDLLNVLMGQDLHAHFKSLPASHQRECVEWIENARKSETRKSRIDKTVQRLQLKVPPQKAG